jgi:signal transduction histidine kinase
MPLPSTTFLTDGPSRASRTSFLGLAGPLSVDPEDAPVSPDLLASICHDLKQHIATGLLLSEVVRGESVSTETSRRFEVLHGQFEHAASLVSILSGDPHQHAPRSDLAVLSKRSVDAVRSSHRVSFEAEGSEHVVLGDPTLLRRAVANVLDNACRAATPAGSVVVRVGADHDERWVEILDDGPGFGNISGGTGRGLLIVRAAVQASAGRLLISEAVGGGAVIRLTFPAADRRGQ